ncbi:hypothetical protein FSP39_024857 [Pinctada imbricata]|uniref:Kinase n=1 Tax=Pinctada imbricata TaxID=66713 RepID=A0AA89BQW3_PINIB|nr:hypothetical protein FSP39_024857 [Pinctada imbricata]
MVLELRRFIPQFFGMVQGSEVCKTSYLKLENLLQDMTKPCVLDIKMGKITIYNPKTKEMEKYDKYYCKKLTEDNIVSNGLAKFFCYQGDLSRDLINSVIEQLEQIEEWFSHQRLFAFYASSILIVFDGDNSASTCDIESSNSDNLETNDTSARTLLNSDSRKSVYCSGRNNRDQDNGLLPDSENSCVQSPRVEVRMIDFTHVFPSREEDSNYLFGLRKLISHLRSVIDSPSGLL